MQVGRGVVWAAFVMLFLGRTGVAEADASRRVTTIDANATRSFLLRSTDRLPGARGAARVERKGGATEIEVELNSMKPASLFGGDYNTYVLWVVPPWGPVENAGEIALEGSRAKAQASTSAPEFALLVAAEPHYLVSAPSAFVIFANETDPEGQSIEQKLIEGVYHFRRPTLDRALEADGAVHTEVRQAFIAVRLAVRAGAHDLAGAEFVRARLALEETMAFWRGRRGWQEIASQARETVRLAVAAQRLAQDRALHGTPDQSEGSEEETWRPEGAAAGAARVGDEER